MEFQSRYKSREPDSKGFIAYPKEEHAVWETLYTRQSEVVKGRACDEFHKGLDILQLTGNHIPQLPDVSERLYAVTKWKVEPVAALISAEAFFTLLAERKFPAATFIRVPEELNYIKEPDIFHELYGHCPLITEQVYADFLYEYANLVLTFPKTDWPLLQRLFWFTVEFGLIRTPQGLRAYGGGILSSIEETAFCLESREPMRVLFDSLVALRMPYRIDMKQTVYFVIDSYEQLYHVIKEDMAENIRLARELGEFAPSFPVEDNNPSIHIKVC